MSARGRRRVHAVPTLVAALRSAAGRWQVLVAIWLWHLVLSAGLAVPVFTWLRNATAYRPAADVLAERWSFGAVAELLHYNEAPVMGMVQAAAIGGLAVATVTAPLLIAFVLRSLGPDALTGRDLGAAAVRLYWPFLRVLLGGRALAVVAVAVAGLLGGSAIDPLRESLGEAGLWWGLALQLTGMTIAGVFLLAAVDYALADLAQDRARGAIRAWIRGARCALVHPVATLGLWAGSGVLLAALVGLYAAVTAGLPATATWFLPAAVILQQVFVLARTWLRAGLLGAEQTVFSADHPALPATPPAAEPAPDSAFLPFDELGRPARP